VRGTSKGDQTKVEAQTESTLIPFQSPGAISTKTDAQVAYGVGFGRSRYVRKFNKKSFPMALV